MNKIYIQYVLDLAKNKMRQASAEMLSESERNKEKIMEAKKMKLPLELAYRQGIVDGIEFAHQILQDKFALMEESTLVSNQDNIKQLDGKHNE